MYQLGMLGELWSQVKNEFLDLGGVASNVEPRYGIRGRGLFAIDPQVLSKVACPKHLLLSTDDICWQDGRLLIAEERADLNSNVRNFLEFYYNEFAWEAGGGEESKSFLEGFDSLPLSFKQSLLTYNLIQSNLLQASASQRWIFERFIATRLLRYKNQSVLVPVWDLVNHSSFSPPFLITSESVETPTQSGRDGELLHRYSSGKSSVMLWRTYGFACRCAIAYTLPFELVITNSKYLLRFDGEQKSDSDFSNIGSICDDVISIPAFPVGCLSSRLPIDVLIGLLSPLGVDQQTCLKIIGQIQEFNIGERVKIIEQAERLNVDILGDLCRALAFEIDLIRYSVFA